MLRNHSGYYKYTKIQLSSTSTQFLHHMLSGEYFVGRVPDFPLNEASLYVHSSIFGKSLVVKWFCDESGSKFTVSSKEL